VWIPGCRIVSAVRATMMLQAGTKLGPYEILTPIGAGGMGEVYRARDSRLRRDVAVKLVPESLAKSPNALARFELEAQTVASLSHPNVVAIFDVGRENGIHYLVMELLEGKTLQERLASGPLVARIAVDLALQAARGLAAAHAKGVVHRDLKPENLLVTEDGFLKILDFGLARQALDSGGADGAEAPTVSRTTVPGTVLGTVGYMSPEQARGRHADARSDIFALGVVLCEMVTGERAFGQGTPVEALSAILVDEPRGLERLEREASPALARLVARCLAKSPDGRFQSAGDLAFALEALTGPSSAALVEAGQDDSPAIAVLPFSNMSPDPDTEYFSDGITEEIINALMHLPGLKVAARTSSFAFKGKNQDLRRVAQALGVSSVLEGSVRRGGSRLRITAQLIDARDGHHVWSERYDRDATDVFAIQDEIAAAIAARLRVTLTAPQEGRREATPTRDPEAYDLYLKGRHFFNKREAPQAIARFEEAITRDPEFASAYTGLADSYGIHAFYGGIDTRMAYARARAAGERARELAPDSAEANLSMGIIEHYFGWDFEHEERELSLALKRSPRASAPRYWMSLLLGLRGGLEEALPLAREAARLDPLSPYAVSVAGWLLLTSGRFEEARAEFLRGLEIDPKAPLPLSGLSRCESGLGRSREAVAAAEELAALADSSFGQSVLAQAYAASGLTQDARRILAALDERARREYVAPYFLLPALVHLRDWDAAFRACERACEERNALAWWGILYDPACEALRREPRFPAIAAGVRARKARTASRGIESPTP
jgi:eukaryotic-like serine/threonine-protein kinase